MENVDSFRVFASWEKIGRSTLVRAGRGPPTTSRRGQRWGRATRWCGCLVAPLLLPFGLRVLAGKIGGWVFVPCNFENVSCVGFLKQKTAENRKLALGILLIG